MVKPVFVDVLHAVDDVLVSVSVPLHIVNTLVLELLEEKFKQVTF